MNSAEKHSGRRPNRNLDDTRMIVIPSSMPEFKQYTDEVQRVQSTLCKRVVAPAYVRESGVLFADTLIISQYVTRQTRAGTKHFAIDGFAYIKLRESDIYVDVICANKTGRKIMQQIISLAKIYEKQFVVLNALANAIIAYRKMGFVHSDKECIENPEIATLANAIMNKRFSTSNEALQDAEMYKLLSQLAKKRLTSNTNCADVENCAINGFTMTLCVS